VLLHQMSHAFPSSEPLRAIVSLAVKHASHILSKSFAGGVSRSFGRSPLYSTYCTTLDCATARVSTETALVQFSPVQFRGPAVVHVEFMVDQVAWRRSFCAACDEIKTAPFSLAPRAG
jgi:hypothetical protein